jgi:hypothetical protein
VRTLRYWTQRAAMALARPPPTGLYDAGVRARFDAVVGPGLGRLIASHDRSSALYRIR